MKLALILAIGLALTGVALVAAPVASACPDPDNPCSPQPIDPLECHPNVKPTWDPLGWLGCRV
jgi:hypothetical protein